MMRVRIRSRTYSRWIYRYSDYVPYDYSKGDDD